MMSSQGIGSDGGTPQQREHDDGSLQTGREKSPGGNRNISMPNNNKKNLSNAEEDNAAHRGGGWKWQHAKTEITFFSFY